jgi:hypothetical protein
MKNEIISAVNSVPGLQERTSQYPILAKKAEAFASEIENLILTLEAGRPTFKVKPVTPTTIEEALELGHYTGHYDYLKNDVNAKIFLDRPLDLPEEEIILGIVPSGKVVPKGRVAEYWDEKGLELVPNADAYLDQLMRDNIEDQLPAELKGKYIVAYTSEPAFRSEGGGACHLCVYRNGVGSRKLPMAFERDVWDDSWVFVLRKKKLEPKS